MIRPLATADLPELAAGLAGLPLFRRYDRSAEQLRGMLEGAQARRESLLVAEEGGAPAGLAWFLTSGTLALGGYLRLLAVLGPFQGRGLGAQLLAAYEAEMNVVIHATRGQPDTPLWRSRPAASSIRRRPVAVLVEFMKQRATEQADAAPDHGGEDAAGAADGARGRDATSAEASPGDASASADHELQTPFDTAQFSIGRGAGGELCEQQRAVQPHRHGRNGNPQPAGNPVAWRLGRT